MSSLKKLSDPDTDPAEVDAIIGAFVRQHENERLRKRWENLLHEKEDKEPTLPPPPKVRRLKGYRKWVLIAAAILLVAVLAVPLLWPESTSGPALLAEDRANIALITYRGGTVANTLPDSLRQETARLFAVGQLAAAAIMGERLISSGLATAKDSLNLALVYGKAATYPETIRLLSPLAEKPNGTYRTESRYWLGVARLGQGDISGGKTTLEAIRPEDGLRLYRKARVLLEAHW